MEDKEIKLKEKEKKSNNRVAYILVASVFIVLGIGIAYNINENSLDPEYEALEKKYNEANSKVTNLENDLSEAKNKLTKAEPWFELSSEKQNEIKEELKKAQEERIAKEETEKKAKEEEEAKKQQEAEKTKNAIVTSIFTNVYLPYADGIGNVSFYSIKQNLSSLGYKYDIEEPTYDNVGTITIYDKSSSDSVFLHFHPTEEGVETLDMIQYNRNKKSVAVSNDYHTIAKRYSVYDGKNRPAYSLSQQKDFIFFE